MNDLKAVILAAGKGTRMESLLPKVLHEVNGEPMVEYSIRAARKAGADEIIVIVGYQGDMVKKAIEEKVSFVEQKEQLGTGHAVMCAKDLIGTKGDTLILCGDTPLIKGETLKKLYDFHKRESNGVTVLSASIDDPTGYGRIIRDASGAFQKIVEHKDCDEDELKVNEINSGMYLFNNESLSASLGRLDNNNSQGEYYLTDTIQIIKKAGIKVNAMVIDDITEIMGVNTKAQLAEAERIMNSRA